MSWSDLTGLKKLGEVRPQITRRNARMLGDTRQNFGINLALILFPPIDRVSAH